MAVGPLEIVTGYLHQVTAALEGQSDGELLRRYSDRRDADAFAVLVQRHGPMVLGVCRRALGFSPNADDAFQATFLTLARNAGRISVCVPGWLYRVAVRTSRKALRRRTLPVRDSLDGHDPFADAEWRDVRRLLDEELERLPARYRTPLVLCYLEGLTRDEAAEQLRCSLRTLHRNLAEGRTRLREHLARRGLAPAVLATAVLSSRGLRAQVSVELAGKTVSLIGQGAPIPAVMRDLIAKTPTLRDLAMKVTLCAAILVGSAVTIIGDRQPVGADPVRPAEPVAPTVVAWAPVKNDKPPADPLAEKVKEAQEKAIKYLKAQQKERDKDVWNWENDTLNLLQPGGTSSLATLALLESGIKIDDEVVARGLKYLRTVEPRHTYVVGLQTQVFCKANQKEDAERIRRNVKWLEEAASWNGGKLLGWSYQANSGNRADNSNTRYAIAGLYAAHKAGFRASKEKFWEDIRDLYLRGQTAQGGWNYTNDNRQGKGTHTMTASGVLGLLHAKEVVGKKDKATDDAISAGFAWIANEFKLENPPHTFYNFDVIAALGRASEKKDFGTKGKKIDWYRDGTDWLLKNQKKDGEWKLPAAIDNFEVVSTSFALRFLASRPD